MRRAVLTRAGPSAGPLRSCPPVRSAAGPRLAVPLGNGISTGQPGREPRLQFCASWQPVHEAFIAKPCLIGTAPGLGGGGQTEASAVSRRSMAVPERAARTRAAGRWPAAWPQRGCPTGRHPHAAQLPSVHADVAMSALRDTPGRDSAMLGLPSIEHRMRRLPAFPTLRRRAARVLRSGPSAAAPERRRDPPVLGGSRHRGSHARATAWDRSRLAVRTECRPNGRSPTQLRGGRGRLGS